MCCSTEMRPSRKRGGPCLLVEQLLPHDQESQLQDQVTRHYPQKGWWQHQGNGQGKQVNDFTLHVHQRVGAKWIYPRTKLINEYIFLCYGCGTPGRKMRKWNDIFSQGRSLWWKKRFISIAQIWVLPHTGLIIKSIVWERVLISTAIDDYAA